MLTEIRLRLLCVVIWSKEANRVETCAGAGAVNDRGKPAGAGKKINESRGKNGSGSYCWRVPVGAGMTLRGISAGKNCKVRRLVYFGQINYYVPMVNSATVQHAL